MFRTLTHSALALLIEIEDGVEKGGVRFALKLQWFCRKALGLNW